MLITDIYNLLFEIIQEKDKSSIAKKEESFQIKNISIQFEI